MAHQERMARGNHCPRGCGYRIHPTHPVISETDGKQICSECRLEEIYEKYRRM